MSRLGFRRYLKFLIERRVSHATSSLNFAIVSPAQSVVAREFTASILATVAGLAYRREGERRCKEGVGCRRQAGQRLSDSLGARYALDGLTLCVLRSPPRRKRRVHAANFVYRIENVSS